MFSVSIDAGNLVSQLKEYIIRVQDAADKTVDETAEDVRFHTDWAYAASPGDTDTRQGPLGADYSVVTDKTGDMEAEVRADGEAAFLEFGAGIHFNGQGSGPHPKAGEMGVSMGMYGRHFGKRDKWRVSEDWWSYGTPATQGMYDAFQQARDKVEERMKEALE